MSKGGAAEGRDGLVSHPPARVTVFDEVDDAFAIAVVVVIVDGEKVTEFIEDDLLRVAEVDVEFLKFGAVRIGAKDAAGVGTGEGFAILFDVVSAVADGPVEFAIGSPSEAIEVVAGEADADAEAVDEGFDLLGFSVVVGVLEAVNAGDHSEVNSAVFFNQAARGAGEGIIEITAINGGFVRDAVAVGVFEKLDDFGVLGELLPLEVIGLLSGPLFVERGAVGEGHGGDVAVDPIPEVATVFTAVADVLDLHAPAVGFSNVDPVLSVKADGSGILNLRLVGESRKGESFRNGDLGIELGRDKLCVQREECRKRKDECAVHDLRS